MALKFTLENLDGLDDATKALYTAKDDAFVLDVEGAVGDAEVAGLRSALQAERADKESWSKVLKEVGKPDRVLGKIAELTAAAKDAGSASAADWQSKIDQLEAKHIETLTAKDQTIATLTTNRAGSDLKAELAKAGVIPSGVDALASLGSPRIKFHEDGRPNILTPDLSGPMLGTGKDHGATISDLAKELAATVPELVKAPGQPGSGKQPGNDQGGTPKKTVVRADFDSMSHTDRAAFSKDGGKVVD